MLFALDNDVDYAVGHMLRLCHHHVILLRPSGMADAPDDDVSVFADNHGAVVITHDKEFSQRRRRNVFGKHVYLDCLDWKAEQVLATHLDRVVELLNSREAIFIRVTNDGATPYPSRWE